MPFARLRTPNGLKSPSSFARERSWRSAFNLLFHLLLILTRRPFFLRLPISSSSGISQRDAKCPREDLNLDPSLVAYAACECSAIELRGQGRGPVVDGPRVVVAGYWWCRFCEPGSLKPPLISGGTAS